MLSYFPSLPPPFFHIQGLSPDIQGNLICHFVVLSSLKFDGNCLQKTCQDCKGRRKTSLGRRSLGHEQCIPIPSSPASNTIKLPSYLLNSRPPPLFSNRYLFKSQRLQRPGKTKRPRAAAVFTPVVLPVKQQLASIPGPDHAGLGWA